MFHQEYVRCGARGYGDGMNAGAVIGLPPVLNFGSPELKAKIIPEVLGGKKFICLAVRKVAIDYLHDMNHHIHRSPKPTLVVMSLDSRPRQLRRKTASIG